MIRMRVNDKQDSACMECGKKWKNTREMVDVLLCGQKLTICKTCQDDLLQKLLRIGVKYDHRLKSQQDLDRASRENTFVMRKINEK